MDKNHSIIYSLLRDNELKEDCFKSCLDFIQENQLFNSNLICNRDSLSDLVASINVELHSADESRSKALRLLEKCLPQCSNEIFSENAILWMQHCTRWPQATINEELKVLDKLITLSSGNPDLKKQISAIIIPRIVERLNSCKISSNKSIILSLRCLRNLLDTYSSSCGPFRNQLTKYFVFVLKNHSENDEVISQASRCLVSLLCCGGGGLQGTNYKERWTSYFDNVLSTCQKLIDELYGNVEQLKIEKKIHQNPMDEFLELKEEYSSNPIMRYYGLRRILYILVSILRSMLLCKFPVSKSFQVENVFNLICRILSVTCVSLQDIALTNDIIALNANISFIHACTFDLLHALIICAKRNLVVYSTLICKLCIQCLKWTSSSARVHRAEPFEKIRRKAYHTLSTWLEVAGSCSSIEVFADELIPLIGLDIEHHKQAITLIMDPGKKKTKRKRNQLSTEMSVKSVPTNSTNEISRKSICYLAHRNLQLVFVNASIFIKWEHHKNMQYLVINQLIDIMKCNTPNEYPSPYSDAKCRLMLYKSLFTLCMEPHPKWFPPTSYAVNIFSAAVDDFEIEISGFCRNAITIMETVNHPKAPTFHFKIEDIELRKSCETSTNRLSKLEDFAGEVSLVASNKVVKLFTNLHEDEVADVSKYYDKNDAVSEGKNSPEKSQHSSFVNGEADIDSKEIMPENDNVVPQTSCVSDSHHENVKKNDSIENKNPSDGVKSSAYVVSDNSPPKKKCKNVNHNEIKSFNITEHDADVTSMLSDFVDTV